MKLRKGLLTILLILGLVIATAQMLLAFDGRSGDLVEVKQGEIVDDDLYIAGSRIVIDGVVKGDLFITGSDALINGTVEGDLFFAGQSLTINGEVKDDVRMGGTAFTLGPKGKIGDDFLAGGYSLETKPGSQIGGQMLFGASQALLAGSVDGNVSAGVMGLQLNGKINGDLNLSTAAKGDRLPFNPLQFNPNAPTIPVVAPGLNIAADATIGGDLNYQSPADQGVDAASVKGKVLFTPTVVAAPLTPQQQVVAMAKRALSRFLGALGVGLFLLWLAPGFMRRAATVLQGNLGSGVGWGILNYVGLPIILLVVLFLVIALSLGFNALGISWAVDGLVEATVLTLLLILAFFIFVIVLVGKVAAAAWLGRVLTNQRDPQRGRLFMPMLLGLLIIAILIALPYAGAIFNLLFSVLGLGAVWLALRGRAASAKPKLHPYALQ